MKLTLRTLDALEQALELAPTLDLQAAEFWTQFSDEPWPPGASERFLRRSFEAPQTVLVVARDAERDEPWGVCLTGPYVDPLRGDATPMVLVLYVDPSLRHRGVARELIDEVTRVLASRGISRLSARVGHNDDALISMGERWGFVRAWEWMLRE